MIRDKEVKVNVEVVTLCLHFRTSEGCHDCNSSADTREEFKFVPQPHSRSITNGQANELYNITSRNGPVTTGFPITYKFPYWSVNFSLDDRRTNLVIDNERVSAIHRSRFSVKIV